eukprot:TRINITY_DN7616_c0_g1_i1.p1 TRINITY_DN7616_c0_g1~~TRINITY_DN7616_c0_g1_i1.p1  ORF type:complete len:1152 (+),score=149.59 TRINITY_DN7616_c0_g1_i1:139-3594(+)
MQFFQPLGSPGVPGPIFHSQLPHKRHEHHHAVGAPPLAQAYADRNLNDICLEYTYEELKQATRNFDDNSMKLGCGSYGGVYKGVLRDGTEVAIKVLDVPNESGFEEEVKVLSKFRHPHLVILMGFARHGAQRLLVYEMLSGGDVHRRLQKSCHEDVAFPWQERASIALDAACGLSHLHHASPKVFHRDIKSPNILLDKNGTAKMADFGLACLSHTAAHRVKRASGTVGYACPLYVRRGVVTEGSEVYSFGMVLLELLTARPPAYMSPPNGANSQIQYLANHINGDIRVAMKLVDQKANWPPPAARAVAELALSCIGMQEESRPNFREIVQSVRAISEMSTSPVAPTPRPAPSVALEKKHQQRVGAGSPSRRSKSSDPMRSGCQSTSVPVPQAQTPQLPLHHHQGALGRNASPMTSRMHHGSSVQSMSQTRPRPCSPESGTHTDRTDFVGGVSSPMGIQRPDKSVGSHTARPAKRTNMQDSRGTPLSGRGAEIFALDCAYAEGTEVMDIAPEKRRIVHRCMSEESGPIAAAVNQGPLCVGRAFQTSLFEELVPQGAARSTISREHFQVWIEPPPSPSSPSRRSKPKKGDLPYGGCNFVLANCSGNGTRVNEHLLQGRGEQAILRHGDLITLARSAPGPTDGSLQAEFIQFRFDTSRSILRDVDQQAENGRLALSTLTSRARSSSRATKGRGTSDVDVAGSNVRGQSQGAPLGGTVAEAAHSLPYREGDPVFFLEVCGPGTQTKVPVERRRFAFAPSPCEGEELYSSLIIGRAHQLEFWQEVLQTDALSTLSRQHLEVQTWRSAKGEGRFSFLARNLSDVNSVHVLGGQEGAEEPMLLSRGEQRHLLDGDRLVLNLGQLHTFWLAFHDLTASTSIMPEEFLAGREADEARRAPTAVGGSDNLSIDVASGVTLHSLRSSRAKSASSVALSSRVEPSRFRQSKVTSQSSGGRNLKDEDDTSTAATPHDLHHEERAEDEDVGAGRFLLKAAATPPFPRSELRSGSRSVQPLVPEVTLPWARARSQTATVTVSGWRPRSGSGSDGEIPPPSSRPSSEAPSALIARRMAYSIGPTSSPGRRPKTFESESSAKPSTPRNRQDFSSEHTQQLRQGSNVAQMSSRVPAAECEAETAHGIGWQRAAWMGPEATRAPPDGKHW